MKSISMILLILTTISCGSSNFISESDLKEEIKKTTLPKQSDYPESDGVILLKKTNMSMKIENDYGIEIDFDGDAISEKRENEIADGYNSVSVPAIEKEFGEDILYNVAIYAISEYSKGLSPEELEEQKEYLESYMEDLINRTVEP